MNSEQIKAALNELEDGSYPEWTRGTTSKILTKEINGHKVQVKSKWNGRSSGKGFTTLFYVDGNRVARAKIVELLLS